MRPQNIWPPYMQVLAVASMLVSAAMTALTVWWPLTASGPVGDRLLLLSCSGAFLFVTIVIWKIFFDNDDRPILESRSLIASFAFAVVMMSLTLMAYAWSAVSIH